MSCQKCVAKITAALQEVDGVIAVTVSLEESHAKIEFKPSVADEECLLKVVVAAGFQTSAPFGEESSGRRTVSWQGGKTDPRRPDGCGRGRCGRHPHSPPAEEGLSSGIIYPFLNLNKKSLLRKEGYKLRVKDLNLRPID